MPSIFSSALVASLAAVGAVAQTFTSCNPLNNTCAPDMALGQYAQFDFTSNQANPALFNTTSPAPSYNSQGAQFIIKAHGDAPTLQTTFTIFWGTVSVVMKASSGVGIVSSIVLLSDDLDEIDWEFLGGNRTMVESNYFGKGNTTSYTRAVYHTLPFAPQDDFHNYTVNWNKDMIQWIVDGNVYRTLNYDQADGHGEFFPQTPMRVSFGSWAAGDPVEPKGVQEWAQGTTNFDDGPFTMSVKQVYIQDGSTGSTYTYGDRTGTWQSIKVASGQSLIVPELNRKIGPKAHWDALSPTTRIAIIASALGAFLIICGLVSWFCIKSARKGVREHQVAEAQWKAQQEEAALWQRKYTEDRLSSMHSTTKSFR